MKIAKLLATALVLPLGSAALADITNWDGVGGGTTTVGPDVYGNWSDPNNWGNGFGINVTLEVVIDSVGANGGRVYVDSGHELWFGDNSANKQRSLTIHGGILQHHDGGTTQKTSRIGDQGAGVVLQTGGVFYMNTGELRLGCNNDVSGNGLYEIIGGTFSTAGGVYPGGNVVLGSRANRIPAGPSVGELRISGNATVELGPPNNDGNALLFGSGTGSNGSSILSIEGADATINIDSISMINAKSNTTDTPALIRFSFDEAGVSTIHLTGDFVYDGTNSASAVLRAGFLDVNYTGSVAPVVGATFDLMTGDLIRNNPALAGAASVPFALHPGDAANWSLAIVGTGVLGDGQQDVLRLTYLGGPLPAPPVATLVGYWPFEADASPQPDHSGFSNHATPNAGATWVLDSERAGGVIEFDGNDSFLEALDSESLSPTGDLTIAAWVKPADYAGFRGIVGKTDVNLPASYDLYLNAGNGRASFLAGSPGSFAGVGSTSAIAAGEWHHLAVTLKDGYAVTYFDGVPDRRVSLPNPLLDSTANVRIGNRADLVTDFLGRMDDVAIFAGALSRAQIGEIMAGDFSRFGLGDSFGFKDISVSGGGVTLTWESQTGTRYDLRSSNDLSLDFPAWSLVEGDIHATEPLNTLTVPKPADLSHFYRLRRYPAPPAVVLSENFDTTEAGTFPAGWTAGFDAADLLMNTAWQLGDPTGGPVASPPAAASPPHCVGTNLTANYGTGSNIRLRTPAIDLTTAAGARLTFQQWVDIDDFDNLDRGTVRVLDAAGLPGTVTELGVVETDINGILLEGWVEFSANLPATALGKSIALEFGFISDGEGTFDGAGWYIDDVVVKVPGS